MCTYIPNLIDFGVFSQNEYHNWFQVLIGLSFSFLHLHNLLQLDKNLFQFLCKRAVTYGTLNSHRDKNLVSIGDIYVVHVQLGAAICTSW